MQYEHKYLTRWGLVMQTNKGTIGSGSGMSPARHQAMTGNNGE